VSIGPAVGGGGSTLGPLTWTPALQGATDNPVPTYTTQQGRWWSLGKLVFVQAQIVTSTMTKTTLTDQVRLSLPVAAANVAGNLSQLTARLENSTAVQNGLVAETTANAAYIVFRMVPPTSSSSLLTYALTSLGVLVNTVTLQVTGWYETV
jgi:hypothetical protein